MKRPFDTSNKENRSRALDSPFNYKFERNLPCQD
jgi:hypothetical protein